MTTTLDLFASLFNAGFSRRIVLRNRLFKELAEGRTVPESASLAECQRALNAVLRAGASVRFLSRTRRLNKDAAAAVRVFANPILRAVAERWLRQPGRALARKIEQLEDSVELEGNGGLPNPFDFPLLAYIHEGLARCPAQRAAA